MDIPDDFQIDNLLSEHFPPLNRRERVQLRRWLGPVPYGTGTKCIIRRLLDEVEKKG
jgi:hypothetical protein